MRLIVIYSLRITLLAIGRLICLVLFRVTVEGREHIPPQPERLMLIANHFSWFDPPVLALALPITPAFVVATEAHERRWVSVLLRLFDTIPIWRGQVDRAAFRLAAEAMQQGKVVGIFPEGGINPDLAERRARGETVARLQGNMSRANAQLIPARAGAALLATMTEAQILPVGVLGTEQIAGNLRRFRRTRIIIRIGPVFGPITADPALRGQGRRRWLDEQVDQMMRRIAALLPPTHRGPYHDVGQEHRALISAP